MDSQRVEDLKKLYLPVTRAFFFRAPKEREDGNVAGDTNQTEAAEADVGAKVDPKLGDEAADLEPADGGRGMEVDADDVGAAVRSLDSAADPDVNPANVALADVPVRDAGPERHGVSPVGPPPTPFSVAVAADSGASRANLASDVDMGPADAGNAHGNAPAAGPPADRARKRVPRPMELAEDTPGKG